MRGAASFGTVGSRLLRLSRDKQRAFQPEQHGKQRAPNAAP
jgi:hypothetical protein